MYRGLEAKHYKMQNQHDFKRLKAIQIISLMDQVLGGKYFDIWGKF